MNEEVIEKLKEARKITGSDYYKTTEIADADDCIRETLALLEQQPKPSGIGNTLRDIAVEEKQLPKAVKFSLRECAKEHDLLALENEQLR